VEIAAAQKLAWENKIRKGFNTTDVALEFGLLTAEVGEAFTAWRKGLPDFGEELADVFLYLTALAEMNGVDLDAEVARKIVKNERRTYTRNAHGALIRTDDAEQHEPSADAAR
jgi:NTP pyrophosphatase (non-canonical NTP hydrolase)